MRERFDFAASLIAPTYMDVLALLAARYEAEDVLARGEAGDRPRGWASTIWTRRSRHRRGVPRPHALDGSPVERDFRTPICSSTPPDAARWAEQLAASAPELERLRHELDDLLDGYEALTDRRSCGASSRALGQGLGRGLPELARALATATSTRGAGGRGGASRPGSLSCRAGASGLRQDDRDGAAVTAHCRRLQRPLAHLAARETGHGPRGFPRRKANATHVLEDGPESAVSRARRRAASLPAAICSTRRARPSRRTTRPAGGISNTRWAR